MSDERGAATPAARRAFVPAADKTGPTDWRTALRYRGPRCGIGVALTLALVSAALAVQARTERGCPPDAIGGLDGVSRNPCLDARPRLEGSLWFALFGIAGALSVLTAVVLLVLVLKQNRRAGEGAQSDAARR
ncbi:MAG: hypothetical protein ACT4PP_16085 [Sporichthyaceae bacterium]